MRPARIEPLPDTPSFVTGASILRGQPAPVIDLGDFLSGEKLVAPGRAVTLKLDGGRRVALLVTEVLGVRGSEEVSLGEMPPLLQESAPEALSTLGRLDDRLLTVLRLGRLVPEPVWKLLSGWKGGA